jgi:riboflavin kinase/FMN adenylyltransferase
MKVWNGIESYPDHVGPVVATIGNYDGVHLGHQAILHSVVETARRLGALSLLITFDPHPLSVVAPSRKPKLLQTRGQKLAALEASGLDAVMILRFDSDMASLGGREFFSQVVCGPIGLAAVHVGWNFRFGRDRSGDVNLLKAVSEERGFDVVGVPPVEVGGRTVSSSAIRKAVGEGDVETARGMLGRPFAVVGEVVRGDGRGRRLEFPTANVEVENAMTPLRGVYVTETVALATRYASVANVGVRPTFGGAALTVETHLLEFDGDLYGERAEVRFLARLRDEQRFAGPEDLAAQIARDRAAAEAYFQNLQIRTE